MKKYGLPVSLVVALALVAFFLGRLSMSNPSAGGPPTADSPPSKTGQEPRSGKDPPVADIPVGKVVNVDPLPAKETPPLVRETDLVRQTLRPGKTYQTILRGTVHTVGTDQNWGVETVVSINYAFEAVIDREIVENDGEVIVEHRHFRDFRSVKIDTDLMDLRLNLGPAKYPIMLGLAAVGWPEVAGVVSVVDGASTQPILELLKALGVDPASITGVKPRVFKVFTQFDTLSGKSVKIVYHNKEGRTGVIQLVPLKGEMTESEKFLHEHSAVLSDVLIFPERTKKVGESWKVAGASFSNLIDPALRAAVGGEVTLSRRANRTLDGTETSVLYVEGGRLELESSDRSEGQLGWFEPRGEMFFSQRDEVIVQAELSGKGYLERVSRGHLLFKTQMKQAPQISVAYTCRVIDTPKEGAK
jgi:hypothetical protein